MHHRINYQDSQNRIISKHFLVEDYYSGLFVLTLPRHRVKSLPYVYSGVGRRREAGWGVWVYAVISDSVLCSDVTAHSLMWKLSRKT